MITVVREINTVKRRTGFAFDQDDCSWMAEKSLYVAKNDEGNYGIVDADGEELLSFDYDSITPLHFGLWQTKKRDKAGAFRLDMDEENTNSLHIAWELPCEYDYMTAERETMIEAYKGEESHIVFPLIDTVIPGAWAICITRKYYHVGVPGFGYSKAFIIDATDGCRLAIDEDYDVIGSRDVYGEALFIMLKGSERRSMIVMISNDGTIKKTKVYDDVPATIYAPDMEGMDEPQPLAFIGQRKGMYFFLDSDLVESKCGLKEIEVYSKLYGKTKNNVKKEMASIYIGNKGNSNYREPRLNIS